MRRHSIIGERLLAGIPSLQRAASLVRSSHERWDGAGYPDHLAGADIPLGARIIFVADAYCAMTRGAAVRRGPIGRARASRAARLLGSQFDPTVVTAFLAVLDGRAAHADTLASLAAA